MVVIKNDIGLDVTGIVAADGAGDFLGRTITAEENTGIAVTNGNGVSGQPVISGIDATNSVKGVASFSSDDFTVASGVVSLAGGSGTGTFELVEIAVDSGDPKLIYDIGGTDKWYAGVDDTDSDKFKIGTGAAVGTNTAMEIESNFDVNTFGAVNTQVKNQDGATYHQISNNNSGTASRVFLSLASENASCTLQSFSSTYTTAALQDKTLIDTEGDLYISSGAADSMILYTNNRSSECINMDSNGHVTFPNTSRFLASATSASGGTLQLSTEIFDDNADFNTGTYTFTAPVTGRYFLHLVMYKDDSASRTVSIVTSNRTYTVIVGTTSSENRNYSFSILADMDASDTAYVAAPMSPDGTAYFSGHLM